MRRSLEFILATLLSANAATAESIGPFALVISSQARAEKAATNLSQGQRTVGRLEDDLSPEAVAEFEKALRGAEAGNSHMANEVGIMFAEGKGVKRDDVEGVRWFQRGADLGNQYAMCNLGMHYLSGVGISKDTVEGLKWIVIGYLTDPLDCSPSEEAIQMWNGGTPSEGQADAAFASAVNWLQMHPRIKNNFGETPWLAHPAKYRPPARTQQ